MIKYCLDKWNENEEHLLEILENRTDLNSCDYDLLVNLVVEHILNYGTDYSYNEWDSERITKIDNGDYQGTLLYLIPRKSYQPSEYEYLMTYVGYGSCSGCDTLQSIQDRNVGKLTERQLTEFIALCRDIISNMIKPYNYGWRNNEEFNVVEFE